MGEGRIPRPAPGETREHREERARASSAGTMVTPRQVGNLRHSFPHSFIHSSIILPLCPFNKFALGAFLKNQFY